MSNSKVARHILLENAANKSIVILILKAAIIIAIDNGGHVTINHSKKNCYFIEKQCIFCHNQININLKSQILYLIKAKLEAYKL